jgi:predicted PurR-regulated permease PerM
VIGVELWLILGLLAALFNFIPNFGPLISGVPAFLLALSESPTKAMWVVRSTSRRRASKATC